MKLTMLKLRASILLSGFSLGCLFAQQNVNLLLNEPLIDRPLQMHKGQLQFNAGYGLHYATQYFQNNGNKFSLEEEGKSILTHSFKFDLRYGITKYLEFSIKTNYLSKNERIRQVIKIGYDNFFTYGGNITTKGLENADLLLSFTLPDMPKTIRFNLITGIVLPAGGNEPKKPEHKITSPYTSPDAFDIRFQYLNRPGDGVLKSSNGIGVKSVFGKIALSGSYIYSFPLTQGEGLQWFSLIDGNTFYYEPETFDYLSHKSTDLYLSGYYQAFPWFVVEMGFYLYQTMGGWREINQMKYALPEIKFLNLSAGFEIMVTPALRVYQSFSLPFSGANIPSGIFIFTNMSFNLFPFTK